MASEVLTVESATLADDACGGFGAASTISGSSYDVSNGNCYRFTLTATDNVGNVATLTTTVKVDTTTPVAPTISFNGLSSGNTYDNGSGTLYYRPSATGGFTVNAIGASDPETGIDDYTFSTLSGFVSAIQSGNKVDVTFDGTSAGGGPETVVADNHAGISSTPATAFTIVADSTVPTGGLISIDPYSKTLDVPIATTAFVDADSGIATNVVTRSDAQAPTAGACPAGGYTGATVVPGASDTAPADGQ
jgi:hypothetical protein